MYLSSDTCGTLSVNSLKFLVLGFRFCRKHNPFPAMPALCRRTGGSHRVLAYSLHQHGWCCSLPPTIPRSTSFICVYPAMIWDFHLFPTTNNTYFIFILISFSYCGNCTIVPGPKSSGPLTWGPKSSSSHMSDLVQGEQLARTLSLATRPLPSPFPPPPLPKFRCGSAVITWNLFKI